MEMKDKKLKMNFQEDEKERRDFDPKEIIEQRNEAMPVPEIMKNDYRKMEMFMKKKRTLE